ncbi:hypothetical protein [Peribacillus loiseleuriae]|uniref:hypothetical protein n=1 Tax=Peribacillus loiseleuriae TaxID=1679170 RepID=UPI003D03BCBD
MIDIKIIAAEQVTLLASDTHISIERVLPKEYKGKKSVEVIKEGSIVLYAKFFSEIIRKLPKNEAIRLLTVGTTEIA